MTVRHRSSTIESGKRIVPAILAVYVAFALAGILAHAGRPGRFLFAVLYLVSAACTPWLLTRLRGARPAVRPVRGLATAASLLLVLAALGHIGEAGVVLGHPALSVANADKHAGGLSGPIQVAGTAGVILGTLLLCLALWRSGMTGPGPILLFLLLIPAAGLPHGVAQQLARSLIVLSVVMWLAVSIRARAALGPAEHSIAHAAA